MYTNRSDFLLLYSITKQEKEWQRRAAVQEHMSFLDSNSAIANNFIVFLNKNLHQKANKICVIILLNSDNMHTQRREEMSETGERRVFLSLQSMLLWHQLKQLWHQHHPFFISFCFNQVHMLQNRKHVSTCFLIIVFSLNFKKIFFRRFLRRLDKHNLLFFTQDQSCIGLNGLVMLY